MGGEEHAPETAGVQSPGDTSGLQSTGHLGWVVCSLCNTAAFNQAGAKDKHHFNPCKEYLHMCAPSRQLTEPNVYLRLEPITAEDTPTRAGSAGDMQMHAGAPGSQDGVKAAAGVVLL